MSKESINRSINLENSRKNANYGKVGSFNSLKRITLEESEDGGVTMSFFSRKKDSPGQVIEFSAEDFRKFQEFVLPAVEAFVGQRGIAIPVDHWSTTDSVKVGVDVGGNPVLILTEEGQSLHIFWSDAVEWAGTKFRVRMMPKRR